MLDAQRREQLFRARLGRSQRHAQDVRWRERDVPQRRQMVEQVMKLKDETDLAPEAPEQCGRRSRPALEPNTLHINRALIKTFEPGDRAKNRRLAGPGRSHQRRHAAMREGEGGAAEDPAIAPPQVEIAHVEDGAHAVGAFHRSSRRRASAPSGSDITRYMPAQSVPGMTQLPRLVAKICVCFVNSTTVSTDTSEESFKSATKSLVMGASAMRKACGPRTRRST